MTTYTPTAQTIRTDARNAKAMFVILRGLRASTSAPRQKHTRAVSRLSDDGIMISNVSKPPKSKSFNDSFDPPAPLYSPPLGTSTTLRQG